MTTTRRDGSPQSSPLGAGVDAAGRVVVVTSPERDSWPPPGDRCKHSVRVAEIARAPASRAPVRIVADARGWKEDLFKPNDEGFMNPGSEPSDPEPPAPSTDAENFDTAVDVGPPDDGAVDNPNADT